MLIGIKQELVEIGDDKLMQEIRSGNVFCFDLLYYRYCHKLYGFVFSILKSREESENIVQDAFLILWENRFKIGKESSVRNYLFTVAYNSSIAVIRTRTRELKFIEYLMRLSEADDSDELPDYDNLNVRIENIISSLPDRQKEVFNLHKREGLKYAEISERLNISVNTIEKHMSAALKTIRKNLRNYFSLFF